MGSTTANRAYRYPLSTDDVRPYEDIKNLADDVDADVDALLDGWTSYTPTWSSTGTAPSIGNGTITGKYKRIGQTVFAHIEVTPGSTTSFGTGAYTFSLPVTAINTTNNADNTGTAYMRDASGTSTGHYCGVSAINSARTGLSAFEGSSHAQLQASSPVTWANGDFWKFDIVYEAA